MRVWGAKSILFVVIMLATNATGVAGDWQWQYPLPQGNTLAKIAFADASTGYAVGNDGTIMVTHDAGLHWDVQYIGVTDHLRSLCVVDVNTVWIVGDNGTILHTTNGGAVWSEQSSGTVNGLNGVFFLDRARGWAAGDVRTIIRTTNGGATWSTATMPTGQGNASINSVTFTSATAGWATGSGSAGAGSLYKSTDGGASWTLAQMLTASGQDIAFVEGGQTGFVVGSGGLIMIPGARQ